MKEGWGRRLRDAKRDYEKARDTKLTYREIGERVAAILKRAAPYTPTAVRAWFEGPEPDAFDVARALARVLEADPRLLVFPDDEPGQTERGVVSPAEVAAARAREAEREAARREAPPLPVRRTGHK